MNAFDLNIFWVFLVGVLSFFSPCTIGLIPSFIAYLTGTSASSEKNPERLKVVETAFFFIVGFMLIFLILGAGVGFLGKYLLLNRLIFRIIAGVFIITMGLIFAINANSKLFKKSFHFSAPQKLLKFRRTNAFTTGMAYSFGWSPCYGPIMGAILTLVATAGSTTEGVVLFGVYSLGFSIPFLIAAIFIHKFTEQLHKYGNALKYFNTTVGILLILLGITILANNMPTFTEWTYPFFETLGIPYNA